MAETLFVQDGLMKRKLAKIAVGTIFLCLSIEAGVRSSGAVDFPTFHKNPEIGYVAKPSQSGEFLHKNAWVFNDRSMGTGRPWNAKTPNILLIGNSVVMGGNPYPQSAKLGPLIEKDLSGAFVVWPIAAGGWSTVNELAYLQDNPDVANAATFFVWEYMSGGLSTRSRWRGEYVSPTERPWIASWYVTRRYLLPWFIDFDVDELPPTGAVDPHHLETFERALSRLSRITGRKVPGIIFLYPTKQEFDAARAGIEWLPERAQIAGLAKQFNLRLVDVSKNSEWGSAMYRDGVHPTLTGNRVLARVLSSEIFSAKNLNP